MLDLDQRLHISTIVDDLSNGAPPLQPEDRQAGMAEGEPTNHRVITGLNEAALCEMQHRLLDSEENERQRLAQDLHDGPLQELHSLDFKLVAMTRQLSDAQQQAQLSEMRSTLRQLARHLRAICQDLRPPALTPFGVSAVLQSFAESFQQAHRELTVVVDLDDDGQRLSERVRLALYRICQHGLRNVAQHAEATRVYVGLRMAENHVLLCIEDNGKGFHVPEDWMPIVEQGKYGLLGCVERAEAVGGHVSVESSPGSGTHLRVVVPFTLVRTPPAEET
jgi:signal transduction histidine kinase